MKKILSCILILSLLLSLCACGGNENSKGSENDASTTNQSQDSNASSDTSDYTNTAQDEDSLLTSYYYYGTIDTEDGELNCRLFLVPSTKEACLCDDLDHKYETATYEEDGNKLKITLEDQVWNFKKTEDALIYIAEGSAPLYATGSFIDNNLDKNTILEDGFSIPLMETCILKSGTYAYDAGNVTLTVDVKTRTYILEQEDGTITESTFEILNDGSCADTKDNLSGQFFPSSKDIIFGAFPNDIMGNFVLTE